MTSGVVLRSELAESDAGCGLHLSANLGCWSSVVVNRNTCSPPGTLPGRLRRRRGALLILVVSLVSMPLDFFRAMTVLELFLPLRSFLNIEKGSKWKWLEISAFQASFAVCHGRKHGQADGLKR